MVSSTILVSNSLNLNLPWYPCLWKIWISTSSYKIVDIIFFRSIDGETVEEEIKNHLSVTFCDSFGRWIPLLDLRGQCDICDKKVKRWSSLSVRLPPHQMLIFLWNKIRIVILLYCTQSLRKQHNKRCSSGGGIKWSFEKVKRWFSDSTVNKSET